MLVRQLERELASTVSALKDERSEKRAQAEALKSRLDKTRGTVRDREAELERCESISTAVSRLVRFCCKLFTLRASEGCVSLGAGCAGCLCV